MNWATGQTIVRTIPTALSHLRSLEFLARLLTVVEFLGLVAGLWTMYFWAMWPDDRQNGQRPGAKAFQVHCAGGAQGGYSRPSPRIWHEPSVGGGITIGTPDAD